MNNYQTNIYRMFLAVQNYLTGQTAITTKISALGRAITKFNDKVRKLKILTAVSLNYLPAKL